MVGVRNLFNFRWRHNCIIPIGIFFNLGVCWLESLGNSFIFVIYDFLDLIELKSKQLIDIMPLMVSNKTKEVLLSVYNW